MDNAQKFHILAAIAVGVLCLGSASGLALSMRAAGARSNSKEAAANFVSRVNSWWVMVAALSACMFFGPHAVAVLFCALSCVAMREFARAAGSDAKRGDRAALGASIFVAIPLQYYFLDAGQASLAQTLIPVLCFLVLPAIALFDEGPRGFLGRVAKTQWGLMIAGYCLSHAVAVLSLGADAAGGELLLLYLLIVAQMSDVLQYVFGKLFGKRRIAPQVSPNKTVEGLVGGGLSAVALGSGLHWMTPFSMGASALLSLSIVAMGFIGGLALSAIKRDAGVKDWGALIPGHGGVLDRLDSVCFAAPVFFYLAKFLLR